jgi:hypothetical protein
MTKPEIPNLLQTTAGLRRTPRLRHWSFPLLLTFALTLLLRTDSFACVACYGNSDSPLAEGMNKGILFLLGCIGMVLAAFVTFFVYLGRRAAAVKAARASNPTQS